MHIVNDNSRTFDIRLGGEARVPVSRELILALAAKKKELLALCESKLRTPRCAKVKARRASGCSSSHDTVKSPVRVVKHRILGGVQFNVKGIEQYVTPGARAEAWNAQVPESTEDSSEILLYCNYSLHLLALAGMFLLGRVVCLLDVVIFTFGQHASDLTNRQRGHTDNCVDKF